MCTSKSFGCFRAASVLVLESTCFQIYFTKKIIGLGRSWLRAAIVPPLGLGSRGYDVCTYVGMRITCARFGHQFAYHFSHTCKSQNASSKRHLPLSETMVPRASRCAAQRASESLAAATRLQSSRGRYQGQACSATGIAAACSAGCTVWW